MYDVLILGAGAAGISASIYCASRGMKTCVIEKDEIGGVIGKVSTVTHYEGIVDNETGKSFAERISNQVRGYDIEFIYEEVVAAELTGDIKVIKTSKGTYEAKTIIIALGTTPKRIGIPGEQEFYKKGVDYWASLYTDELKGKDVYVIGGSDGAVKEALYIAEYAKKVTLVHFEEKISAINEFTSRAERCHKMNILVNSRVTGIFGEGCIDAIEIKNIKTGEISKENCPGGYVFIYAGGVPNTHIFKDCEMQSDFIKTDECMRTNIEGVYAAGDIRHKQVKQVSTAVSDGTIAGINAFLYLNTKTNA